MRGGFQGGAGYGGQQGGPMGGAAGGGGRQLYISNVRSLKLIPTATLTEY